MNRLAHNRDRERWLSDDVGGQRRRGGGGERRFGRRRSWRRRRGWRWELWRRRAEALWRRWRYRRWGRRRWRRRRRRRRIGRCWGRRRWPGQNGMHHNNVRVESVERASEREHAGQESSAADALHHSIAGVVGRTARDDGKKVVVGRDIRLDAHVGDSGEGSHHDDAEVGSGNKRFRARERGERDPGLDLNRPTGWQGRRGRGAGQ